MQLHRARGDRAAADRDSVAAIVAFAGADCGRARCYPEDDAYLLEREPHVLHFEVVRGGDALEGASGVRPPPPAM